MEAYRKKTLRTTKKKMFRFNERGPKQNRSLRLERTSPEQRKIEGFSDGGENS